MGITLYVDRKGFSRPYLRCLIPDEVDYVMRKVHEGVCGNHSRARLLVHKIIRVGYYWPTMQKDAQSYVKACNKCQGFNKILWINIIKGRMKKRSVYTWINWMRSWRLLNNKWSITKTSWLNTITQGQTLTLQHQGPCFEESDHGRK